MINGNTMLGFLATDACIPSPDGLNWRWHWRGGRSTDATVDDDTSTNDSFWVVATEPRRTPPINGAVLTQLLFDAMLHIARQLACHCAGR
jgi:glutamate N-acetyltransferase/amino-acid N-acetyltransferase